MKRCFKQEESPTMRAFILLVAWIAFAGVCSAADPVKQDPPAPATERSANAKPPATSATPPPGKPPVDQVFEPPPVPEFMLKKPEKPLTLEEMKRQADEAAERARRARAASGAGSTTSGADAESAGNSSKQPAK